MSSQIFIALVIFAFVACVTPGPNTMMLLASGTRHGFAPTIPHMFGICFGLVFMMVMVGAGLIKIFVLFPVAHTVLKVLGILYLLYLAWAIATAETKDLTISAEGPARKPITFGQAVLLQWVNPKAITMALTAITAFVPKPQSAWGLAFVAIVFGIVCLPTCVIWALMGAHIRRFLNNPAKQRTFNVAAAIALILSLYPIVMA